MVRVKRRYSLCELVYEDGGSDGALSAGALGRCIKDAVGRLHGDFGYGCVQSSLSVKYLNTDTRVAIVRCVREHHHLVQTALPTVASVGGRQCFLRTLHVGGTIRSCQKTLIAFNRRRLLRLLREASPAEQPKYHQMLCGQDAGFPMDTEDDL
eukprot:m.497631 g.497631  ORF g.497631 m.497631 type:complete len:153 (+) comp51906_c0_seq1:202-660(+)